MDVHVDTSSADVRVHGCDGSMRAKSERSRDSRYGLRGGRVGEASHPRPGVVG